MLNEQAHSSAIPRMKDVLRARTFASALFVLPIVVGLPLKNSSDSAGSLWSDDASSIAVSNRRV